MEELKIRRFNPVALILLCIGLLNLAALGPCCYLIVKGRIGNHFAREMQTGIWGIASLSLVVFGIYHLWRTFLIQWDQEHIQIFEETKRGGVVWSREFRIEEDQIAFHFIRKGSQFSIRKDRIGDRLLNSITRIRQNDQAAESDGDKPSI